MQDQSSRHRQQGDRPAYGRGLPAVIDERTSYRQAQIAAALQRLATATANVGLLEAQAGGPAPGDQALHNPISPAEVRSLEQLHNQIDRARVHAAGRFGGHTMRTRLVQLQTEERERLDRHGVRTFDEFLTLFSRQEHHQLNAVALEVARREAQAAQADFIAVANQAEPARVSALARYDDEILELEEPTYGVSDLGGAEGEVDESIDLDDAAFPPHHSAAS